MATQLPECTCTSCLGEEEEDGPNNETQWMALMDFLDMNPGMVSNQGRGEHAAQNLRDSWTQQAPK